RSEQWCALRRRARQRPRQPSHRAPRRAHVAIVRDALARHDAARDRGALPRQDLAVRLVLHREAEHPGARRAAGRHGQQGRAELAADLPGAPPQRLLVPGPLVLRAEAPGIRTLQEDHATQPRGLGDPVKIEHVMHGDAELWARLGEFFASRDVHKALGGPIYSAPGSHWWIATERGKVLGFASMRPTSTAVWLDYAYVAEGARGQGIHAQLCEAREKLAAELHPDLPLRVAVRADRWRHYKRRGWTVASERGEWVHGIREVQS